VCVRARLPVCLRAQTVKQVNIKDVSRHTLVADASRVCLFVCLSLSVVGSIAPQTFGTNALLMKTLAWRINNSELALFTANG